MALFIIILVLCGLAFLVGAPLNAYIIFITRCRMERTVSTVWFLNRATADLIFIIFLPIRLTFEFIWHSYWAHSLIIAITSFHMFSSAFFLTALSISRCIFVACPEWAQNHCTPCLAFWVGLGIWALSLGFCLRESLYSSERVWIRFWLGEERLKPAVVIQFLVGFLIPLALILIPTFYIVLAAKLRRNRLMQSTKPLKILLGLVPTFLICWFPYHVFSFLLISHTYLLNIRLIESISSVLTYFNSCLNPIFYLTMEEEFLKHRQHSRNPQTINGLELEAAE